jgi:pimeloyl-ACP methyl ester carboxylesterase
MTSSYSWRYVLQPLGEHFTLYAPDLPGSGSSAKPAGPYDPGTVAAWIGHFQSSVGIRGCPVIGNSLGGYLAMRLALDDPGSMSRLLNLHSPGVPDLRLRVLRAALSVPGVQRLLAAFVRRNPQRWAHTNVHYFDETLKSLEEAKAYGDPLADVAGSRAFVRILHETVHWRAMRDQLARLRALDGFVVPLLLLYARHDPMVPPEVGPALAAATGAELRWLQEASHFAHVDATETFVAEALAFLL